MRKLSGIVLLMMVAAIVIFISSCGGAEYEPSTVVLDESAEKFLTISVEETDCRKGVFILKNRCEEKISYGDRNYLEINIEGEWKGLVRYNQRTITEPSYDLWPGESTEYKTEWDVLENGNYRYVLPFTVIGNENKDSRQSFCIAVQFEIHE